jgi:hypothetical protein
MRLILLMLSAAVLCGCSTSYKPNGLSGGYSETQLSPNVFKVSFRGNGFTKAEKAADFALLRSAEVTLQNGFTHFVIFDNSSSVGLSSYTTPVQSYTTLNATTYGNTAYGTASTTSYGGQTHITSKPETTNTIMCFKGSPDSQRLVYEARFICESIGSKYKVACNQTAANQRLNSTSLLMDCQTSIECNNGLSCRSKKGGGSECR